MNDNTKRVTIPEELWHKLALEGKGETSGERVTDAIMKIYGQANELQQKAIIPDAATTERIGKLQTLKVLPADGAKVAKQLVDVFIASKQGEIDKAVKGFAEL